MIAELLYKYIASFIIMNTVNDFEITDNNELIVLLANGKKAGIKIELLK